MERRDWNLLVLSAAGGEPLSPVQLQKALFLLGKNLPAKILGEDFYRFEPYNYGPFDSKVYLDAQTLSSLGLAAATRPTRGGWEEYSATPSGVNKAKDLCDTLPQAVPEYITGIVTWVRSLPFASLVREIYRLYPDTKVNSVFRD